MCLTHCLKVFFSFSSTVFLSAVFKWLTALPLSFLCPCFTSSYNNKLTSQLCPTVLQRMTTSLFFLSWNCDYHWYFLKYSVFHLGKIESLQRHYHLVVLEQVLPPWQYERPLHGTASSKTEETQYCGFSSACEFFNNVSELSAAVVFISENLFTQL